MQKMLILLISFVIIASITAYSSSTHSVMKMVGEKSRALPFLARPKKLDGKTIIGDFGFDPLGLSENVSNFNYVQAAEIKHGRVAMVSLKFLSFYIHFYV